jgi:hypothetical protein
MAGITKDLKQSMEKRREEKRRRGREQKFKNKCWYFPVVIINISVGSAL